MSSSSRSRIICPYCKAENLSISAYCCECEQALPNPDERARSIQVPKTNNARMIKDTGSIIDKLRVGLPSLKAVLRARASKMYRFSSGEPWPEFKQYANHHQNISEQPQEELPPLQALSLQTRIVITSIDAGILIICLYLSYAITQMLQMLTGSRQTFSFDTIQMSIFSETSIRIIALFSFIYGFCGVLSGFGTFGMFFVRARCMSAAHVQIPPHLALFRAFLASFFGFGLGFSFWWPLLDPYARTLHDILCQTVILQNQPTSKQK